MLWVAGFVFGAASAERDIRHSDLRQRWVQFAVRRYTEQHGHSAPNLDSVFISEPLAERFYRELGGAAQVRYERVGARDYRLSFAGYDGKFGTLDDKVFTARDLPGEPSR